MSDIHCGGTSSHSRSLPDSSDEYWIVAAPVQFGLRKITCLFRFETSAIASQDAGPKEDKSAKARLTYTLWVSSREDPALLYSCRMDSCEDLLCLQYATRTPSILKSLIKGANLPSEDVKHTLINLIGENDMGLFIRLSNCSSKGDTPSAVRLALCTPSGSEWKSHLLSFIETLRSDLRKERWQRELLEKDALTMKSQLAQLEHHRDWQEKELEMLYAMIQQQPSSSGIQIQKSKADDSSLAAVAANDMLSEPSTSSGADAEEKIGHRTGNGTIPNEELLLGVVSQLLCSLCPEEVSLPDQDHMREHFISRHLDDEKGKCRACPEASSSVDPVTHMKVHLSRVYACEYCGKKGRKHYLKAHIRTHTGEKPFKCETCARSFADSSTFRRHQMVHTGEKKHSCPICGRCIARKDNVKTHIRSHARGLPTQKNVEGLISSFVETAKPPDNNEASECSNQLPSY